MNNSEKKLIWKTKQHKESIINIFQRISCVKLGFENSKTSKPSTKVIKIAMILSLSMAFKYSLELPQLAEQLDNCVRQFISKGYRTKDLTDDDNFIYTNKVASKILDILDEFEND